MASVKGHIQPQSDVGTCDITLLPRGNIRAVINLIGLASMEEAELLLARLNDVEQEVVYKTLATRARKGEWYMREAE